MEGSDSEQPPQISRGKVLGFDSLRRALTHKPDEISVTSPQIESPNVIQSSMDDPLSEQEQGFLNGLESLFTKKISRRQFLVGSTIAGAFAADEFFLHGLGRYYLRQLVANPEFRNKLLDSLKSGEFFEEDLPRLVDEIVGGSEYTVELGDKASLTEEWMNHAFPSYEVRKIRKNQKDSNQFVLIANLGEVDIIEADEMPPNSVPGAHVTDLSTTAQHYPGIAILPRPQVKADIFDGTDGHEYSQLQPLTWTQFQKSDGSIYEQLDKDGTRNVRGGAYVLIGNTLQVVDASDLNKYHIGQNDCRTTQVCAYTIRSEHKKEDLAAIDNAQTLSGLSPNSESYCSFVATFTTSGGNTETRLISIYNHFNQTTGAMTGNEWTLLEQLSPKNATEICDQIMQEQHYDGYIIAIPDANEHSTVVTTDIISDDQRKKYGIDTIVGYYHGDKPFARTLWARPYLQVDIPLLFLAAKNK